MTLHEYNELFVKNILGAVEINDPKNQKIAFTGSLEKERLQQLAELNAWCSGDSQDLDAFYKSKTTFGCFYNPVLNDNKKNYFWAYVEEESQRMKKVHTGIPSAAITTLVNALQDVTISSENEETRNTIKRIIENEDFSFNQMLNQESRPSTLGLGDGAYKPIFDKNVSDTVLIQWYDAQDVEFIEDRKILVGIIFKDYYEYKGKKYVFEEIRRKDNGNAKIEYMLFELTNAKNGQYANRVLLNTIPQTALLEENGIEIVGLNMVLGVRSRYYKSKDFATRGESILKGKIDIADEMDMCRTVLSMTIGESTPTTYYPVDLIRKNKKNGSFLFPKKFGKKFLKSPITKGENGEEKGEIKVDAPNFDFSRYYNTLEKDIELFLSGKLSPCSIGIGLSHRDNAEAQREKEKVTISTRNNIIESERNQIRKLIKICLVLQKYLDTNTIPTKEEIDSYDISVKYNTFASATFETMAAVLNPLFISGAISPKMLVDKLYGDTLSPEEKEFEIAQAEKTRVSNNETNNYDDEDIEV